MKAHIGFGIGAGLASALLFAAVGTGSLASVLLMYLAPLPILIVGLGWHQLVGLLGLAVGAVATSFLLGPQAVLAFALGPALAGWLIACLCLLPGRPAAAAGGPGGAAPAFLTAGTLLMGIALLAAVLAFASLVASASGDYERYTKALARAASVLVRQELGGAGQGPVPSSLGLPGPEIIRVVVATAPGLLAGLLTLILVVNAWLAARTVAISGRLPRAWPDLPAARMPPVAIGALLAGLALSQAPAFTGVAGTALLGAGAMAFALQGLALTHDLSRGRPARGLVLTATYLLGAILVYAVLPAFALLGIADTALPLRRALRRNHPLPPT